VPLNWTPCYGALEVSVLLLLLLSLTHTTIFEIVPSKCQVPKPVKLLEGIGNGGNSALIWNTAILRTNDQHFTLLQSTGVYGKPSL